MVYLIILLLGTKMPTTQGISINLTGLAIIFAALLTYELTFGAVGLLLAWLTTRRPYIFGPVTALAILVLFGLFHQGFLRDEWNRFTLVLAVLGVLALILASVHGYSLYYALCHRPYWPYLVSIPPCVLLSCLVVVSFYRGGDSLGDTFAILGLWSFIGVPLGVIVAITGVTLIRSIRG